MKTSIANVTVPHEELMFVIEAFLRAKRMLSDDEVMIDADLGLELVQENKVQFEIMVAEDEDQASFHELLDPAPVEQINENIKVIDMQAYRFRNVAKDVANDNE